MQEWNWVVFIEQMSHTVTNCACIGDTFVRSSMLCSGYKRFQLNLEVFLLYWLFNAANYRTAPWQSHCHITVNIILALGLNTNAESNYASSSHSPQTRAGKWVKIHYSGLVEVLFLASFLFDLTREGVTKCQGSECGRSMLYRKCFHLCSKNACSASE